ncbi:MAG: ATP-binding protein [Acidobacteriota bacterium]
MSTSTRLILLLMVLVGAAMAAGGYYFLKLRREILESALHNEVRAHAVTLQLMLEDDYRAGRDRDAQQFINRLSQNTRIYSVILYDGQGRITMLSDPLVAEEIRFPPEVQQVLKTGETAELVRSIGDRDVFSIIMPVQIRKTQRGAFEITQPRSLIRADYARARRDIALITLTLFAVISLGVLVVMRTNLARPIKELLTGAAALGEGDLNYRVIVPGRWNEFSRLASEFNRMADRLGEQRQAIVQAAEECLTLEQQLLLAERLASLGRLAAGVAHEMGAPLNVIKGRIEQLRERPDTPREKVERNLAIINHQADVIARIVRELLNLSRPFHIHHEPVELPLLVQDVFELIEADAAKSGIRLEYVGQNPTQVLGDRELLHQVLMNICLNSVQAMKTGGSLRVEIPAHETVRDGRTLAALRISDTGPGIAPEHMNRVFDPFFTTKEVGEGIGMGLSVSRRIVEEHGGFIEVANQIEGGAIFTVWLPVAQAAQPAKETLAAQRSIR